VESASVRINSEDHGTIGSSKRWNDRLAPAAPKSDALKETSDAHEIAELRRRLTEAERERTHQQERADFFESQMLIAQREVIELRERNQKLSDEKHRIEQFVEAGDPLTRHDIFWDILRSSPNI